MSNAGATSQRPRGHGVRTRRGGVYLAVLGAAMVVTIIGLSAMSVVRLEHLTAEAGTDAVKARFAAESALELAMLETRSNALWRVTNPNGVWSANQTLGDATFSIAGRDPYDSNLADSARDPVVIRGVGTRGQARHIAEVTLVDSGTTISALSSALAAAGDVQVQLSCTLTVSGAPLTSNATLRNSGTIDGDAAALLILNSGTITGSSSILALPRQMPDASVVDLYRKMGTALPAIWTLERVVLAPKYTSYGVTNPDGIYVIEVVGDVIIRDVRIHGTLVVINPGCLVVIEQNVHIENASPDCPALVVHGNLVLRHRSNGDLSESSEGVNFNPAGAPYGGVEDADQTDTYPSEIRGLVHCTGTLAWEQDGRVVGCVVSESGQLLTAVDLKGNNEITYNPKIVERPPMGYSTTPLMTPRPGTWTQVILP